MFGPSTHAIARRKLPTSACPHSTSSATPEMSHRSSGVIFEPSEVSEPSSAAPFASAFAFASVNSRSTSVTMSFTAPSMNSVSASTSAISSSLGVYASVPAAPIVGTAVKRARTYGSDSTMSCITTRDSPTMTTLAPTSSRMISSTRTSDATWLMRSPCSSALGGWNVRCAKSPPVLAVTSSRSARNRASYRCRTCVEPGRSTSSIGKSIAGSTTGFSSTSTGMRSWPV
mmetsp:Transcript_2990/g.12358  ORF Transcript_2990/g.12358 Transcript_2990/m.12358 type:complete len:229 (-) Transcript_2990:195-881(-)